MKTFVWDEHFITGLETVDKQHHHLVDLFNQLGESLMAGNADNDDALQDIFAQVADYAKYHFAEEERLMLEAGIAPQYLDRHRKIHHQFIDQVSAMWKTRSSISNPSEVFLGFLSSWLGYHILGEDQAMARQIALIRKGESPARAYEIETAPIDNNTAPLLTAMGNLYHVLSEQNRDLAAANLHLEERVGERTKELAQANLALVDVNRQLELLSRTDKLLGIANRRYFDDKLEEEWRRAMREKKPLALLMIDVDCFKRYNDTYGHQIGDNCLQSIAKATASALHRQGDLLARYGGEELVIILPNTDLNGANVVASNVCAKVSGLHIKHTASSVTDHVTVSIGAASAIPDKQTNTVSLVNAADGALYAAKEGGRNRVCSG